MYVEKVVFHISFFFLLSLTVPQRVWETGRTTRRWSRGRGPWARRFIGEEVDLACDERLDPDDVFVSMGGWVVISTTKQRVQFVIIWRVNGALPLSHTHLFGPWVKKHH